MNEQSLPLVVHIIYSLGTGGLENGLVNLINRSPVGRYRHAIVCLSHSGEFAQRITAPDVEIIELHKKAGQDLSVYWRLWCTLLKLRPAVVHSRNLAALESQFVAFFLPGVKRVHGEHGRDIGDLEGLNWKYRLLRKMFRPIVQRYVAVSKDLAIWLNESIGIKESKIAQIYNGVDFSKFECRRNFNRELFPPAFLPDRPAIVLGTVGRLAPVKDQSSIIAALSLLFNRRAELKNTVRVILVGDGPERAVLQKQVSKLDLSDYVWLAGDRNDIPELLQSMDIFLLPSLGEGLSNTVLEAMASGLPVIATNVGGNSELVVSEVTGLLVSVGDIEDLSQAMQALVDAPDMRDSMGRNARKTIENKFDWSRAVEEYFTVYDELLAR
jgi:sugar transferase (PEP-CTERM/EpsH1 system associated)